MWTSATIRCSTKSICANAQARELMTLFFFFFLIAIDGDGQSSSKSAIVYWPLTSQDGGRTCCKHAIAIEEKNRGFLRCCFPNSHFLHYRDVSNREDRLGSALRWAHGWRNLFCSCCSLLVWKAGSLRRDAIPFFFFFFAIRLFVF